MNPLLVFFAGGAAALVGRDKLRGAYLAVVRGTANAYRDAQAAAETIKTDFENAAAELETAESEKDATSRNKA